MRSRILQNSHFVVLVKKKKIYFTKIKFPHLSFGGACVRRIFLLFVLSVRLFLNLKEWLYNILRLSVSARFLLFFFYSCGGCDDDGSGRNGFEFWLIFCIVRRAKNYLLFMLVVMLMLMFFSHFCLKYREIKEWMEQRAKEIVCEFTEEKTL